MEMKLFDNWKDIPTIHLDLMDRKIFTGKNVMLVRNEVHPKTTMPAHSHRHEQLLYIRKTCLSSSSIFSRRSVKIS